MQFDPNTPLDLSQISIGKPYHGPSAHSYVELMNWNMNHASNGTSVILLLVFIAVLCWMFCMFGIYDLYKGKQNEAAKSYQKGAGILEGAACI